MHGIAQPRNVRDSVYACIRPGAGAAPNAEWLAQIVASWCAGAGCLPDCLGLEPQQFAALRQRYFPACAVPESAASGIVADFSRMLEKDDLMRLLHTHAAPDADDSRWLAAIVVAACLGNDHLWQDLGLWSRAELTAMLRHNFPALAAKNVYDMKWKKFLYKQLCEAEGLFVCRAPSCAVCCDYQACFGPEE